MVVRALREGDRKSAVCDFSSRCGGVKCFVELEFARSAELEVGYSLVALAIE